MPRLSIPFAVADISALSRSLLVDLTELGRVPGHLELMNMLARGAGYGNFQHLRANMQAEARLAPAEPKTAPADLQRVTRAANYFGDDGVLLSWPAKSSVQELCLWVLWSRLPSDAVFNERQISELLRGWHAFGDHALLRRALFGWKLVDRTIDGREYRRIEQAPPPELAPLLEHLAGRSRRA